jgi:hypothetical protein
MSNNITVFVLGLKSAYEGEHIIFGDFKLKPILIYSSEDPKVLRNYTKYRAGGVAKVVECLYSKCEVLSANHSNVKKKKRITLNLISLFYINRATKLG